MFKLVVLSLLLAAASAYPSVVENPIAYSAPTVTVQQSELAHVGNIVKSIPSAISHHSNSVVHSSVNTVEDVVAPAVKTTAYTTKTVATPIEENYFAAAAPTLIRTFGTAPIVENYPAALTAPVVHTYRTTAPILQSNVAAVARYAVGAPWTYTANEVFVR